MLLEYDSIMGKTRTPLTTVDELRCSGRVSSSCSTCYTRLVEMTFHYIIGLLYEYCLVLARVEYHIAREQSFFNKDKHSQIYVH
jgi:hypothetical protein